MALTVHGDVANLGEQLDFKLTASNILSSDLLGMRS